MKPIAIITGAGGLIGAEACRRFSDLGYAIVGIDNDMRSYFFGAEASTEWSSRLLSDSLPDYEHHNLDIRDRQGIDQLIGQLKDRTEVIVHTAAQPSHDWAAREPFTDFDINAVGTLNMLESMRTHCPRASFVFTSTNKVYGDSPNALPLVELDTRWEIDESHAYFGFGIPEDMSIDRSTHSIFGASKVAADILVQEYGRYFGLNTVTFRGGCLTGPGHAGAELHGFLAYLMKCTATGRPYTIFGYKGKQVRDNIHCSELLDAFQAYVEAPQPGKAYNIGGGTKANCSMLEAIDACQDITGRELAWTYDETNRIGDHIWYVSDLRAFSADYPAWSVERNIRETLEEIHAEGAGRWDSAPQSA